MNFEEARLLVQETALKIFKRNKLIPPRMRLKVLLEVVQLEDSVHPGSLEGLSAEEIFKLLRSICYPLKKFSKKYQIDYTMIRRMFCYKEISDKEGSRIAAITGIELIKAGIRVTKARKRGVARRGKKNNPA